MNIVEVILYTILLRSSKKNEKIIVDLDGTITFDDKKRIILKRTKYKINK